MANKAIIFDPKRALRIDIKMAGMTGDIFSVKEITEHPELIEKGTDYFCIGEEAYKSISKQYHLGLRKATYAQVCDLPKITTNEGIRFTFVKKLNSTKFKPRKEFFYSKEFDLRIKHLKDENKIITKDLSLGMKYLREWISGERPYVFGFGMDYETFDVGMGHKTICGVGIATLYEAIFIDFRYPKSKEEWEEFKVVYSEWCMKYRDVIWTYNSSFEFSRTKETFGIFADFQDAGAMNIVDGRQKIFYTLKYTAQYYCGVSSWDDDFERLCDFVGKLFKTHKGVEDLLADKKAMKELRSQLIDDEDFEEWVDLLKNKYPKYYGDRFGIQTYRNLGKYCCIDAYNTLMIAMVQYNKYPQIANELICDNLRMGLHLGAMGAFIDIPKRSEYKKIGEKYICYSIFKLLSMYYTMKITPLDTSFMDKLSPLCRNIIDKGFNPISDTFWKDVIASCKDSKAEYELNEYKLGRIVGDAMLERVKRYLNNKRKKLSGYTRSKTMRADFERYRLELFTQDDKELIKNYSSEVARARANKSYESKLKILRSSELAYMSFDEVDHHQKYEFNGAKRSLLEIYKILNDQWLKLSSPAIFDKVRDTLLNYNSAIPMGFTSSFYRKSGSIKRLFGEEYVNDPLGAYEKYKELISLYADKEIPSLIENEDELLFYKDLKKLTKPKNGRLNAGTMYDLMKMPAHSHWSRWGSQEKFKDAYAQWKVRLNRFIGEWECDLEIPLTAIRSLYMYKLYTKDMQYINGIYIRNCHPVKLVNDFLDNVRCEESEADIYKIPTKWEIMRKATKRNSSGFHTLPHECPTKGVICAPKGYLMSYFDISQAEPRTVAYLSGDAEMKEIYESGKDMYYVCAATMLGIPYEEMVSRPDAKNWRTKFKVVMLALLYGKGPATLAGDLDCDEAEAKHLIQVLFSRFPAVKELIRRKSNYPEHHNNEIETFWGDKLYVDSREAPDRKRRAGINYAVQGGTSLALTAGFYGVTRLCEDYKLPVRPCLAVHDALINYHRASMIFDLNPFYYEAFTERVYAKTGVRYAFSVTYGSNYYDMAEVTNLEEPNTILIDGSNQAIVNILKAIEEDGVEYEVVSKKIDIEVSHSVDMKKYDRLYGESCSYNEDTSKNKVVIRRLSKPKYILPKVTIDKAS